MKKTWYKFILGSIAEYDTRAASIKDYETGKITVLHFPFRMLKVIAEASRSADVWMFGYSDDMEITACGPVELTDVKTPCEEQQKVPYILID